MNLANLQNTFGSSCTTTSYHDNTSAICGYGVEEKNQKEYTKGTVGRRSLKCRFLKKKESSFDQRKWA